ncbi:MAG: phosphatidylserine decarboxylase [Candidatus Endobugula sp.]|jgi:phosphatidylserine decarboxylase
MKKTFFIALQYLLPQHALSRLAGWVAETKITWVKHRIICWFIGRYNVDMSIAANPDPASYRHFNDFFTRPLAQGQRPITEVPNAIICPADGCISQIGGIVNGHIFQAKGQEYSLLELVGGDVDIAKQLDGGLFATVYLSPKDYHRVHMPLTGTLKTMIHVPGDLFSVNETTADNVPRLFARNERVVALFDTEHGPMTVILVGAMIVASIETVWSGLVTPIKKQVRTTHYHNTDAVLLEKGEEMGRFKLGSTAIVLLGRDTATWDDSFVANSPVMMGEKMGRLL